jgi:hypothetical protein
MEMSENINELAAALAAAQSQMGSAAQTAQNPFFKSKYADLGEVVRAVKQPFSDNGLSYTQFPIREGESAGVVTMLMHTSGQWMRQSYTLPLAKFDAQSVGSCLSYARRYALQSVAGIPSGSDSDDDGNLAVQAAPKEIPDELAEHNRVAQECWSSVACIKQAIKDDAWDELAEAWEELTNDEKKALWVAPSKGGIFTTVERKALKSDEFNQARKARLGE